MTPEQARAARALLKVGVREVAEATNVTPNTISRIESSTGDDKRGPHASTIKAIRTWYESKGISFIEEFDTATGPGVCYQPS